MKIKVVDVVYWVLAFLPLIITGITFQYLPYTIPMHFNSLNQVDRYSSRAELFILPSVIIGIAIIFWFFFLLINKRTNAINEKIVQAFKLIVIGTFSVMSIIVLIMICRFEKSLIVPDLYKLIVVLLGLGDVVMANYLPKCKRNGWAGIRTAWTLKNDDIWYKTHCFAGWLISIGGVLSITVSMFFKGITCLLVFCLWEISLFAIVVIYSYLISKRRMTRYE